MYDNYARGAAEWPPIVVDGRRVPDPEALAHYEVSGLGHTTATLPVNTPSWRHVRLVRKIPENPQESTFYGNFGAGNLGNECTLQAVIEQTLRR